MPVAKDLTELVDINPVRVDRVKTPANGFPVLIMKSVAKASCCSMCGPECQCASESSPTAAKETSVTDTSNVTNTEPTPTPPAPSIETPPVEKSLDERIEEAVAKQVAPIVEGNKVLTERNKALEAELAAMKALPVPGGPAVSAAVIQGNAEKSRANDAEAARYERLSKEVQDRDQARYYAEKARKLRAS